MGRADDNPKQYRALITSALEEYEIGNFEEAMSLFERAHHIEPSARTLRGMGLASYQARKYVLAIGYLRAALTDPRKPLTPQFRRDVETALEAAQGFVATFELVIEPANAALTLDGELIDQRNGGSLQLDPGEHEVVATAPGYKADSRRVKATSGRRGRIELQLARDGEPTATVEGARRPPQSTQGSPPVPPLAEPKVPSAIKALAIGGLSLALVGGALGTGAGLKALSEEDKLADACPDKQCMAGQAGELNDAKRWGTASTVSLAVGGAGLVAGLVGIVYWVRRTRDSAPARPRARLTPLLMGSGFGLLGTF